MKPSSAESVAGYCRVSIRQQKTEVERWLKGHGPSPKTVQWFEDDESGKLFSVRFSMPCSRKFLLAVSRLSSSGNWIGYLED